MKFDYITVRVTFFFEINYIDLEYRIFLNKPFIPFRRAAQHAAAAAASVAAQTGQPGSGSRKLPPPFLRSQTLPTIILPSMAILSAQLDQTRLTPGK